MKKLDAFPTNRPPLKLLDLEPETEEQRVAMQVIADMPNATNEERINELARRMEELEKPKADLFGEEQPCTQQQPETGGEKLPTDTTGSEATACSETTWDQTTPPTSRIESTSATAPPASPPALPSLSSVGSRLATAGKIEVEDNSPHVLVRAGAGCGKTTTIVESLKVLLGQPTFFTFSEQQKAIIDAVCLSRGKAKSVVFCCFNSSIAEELKRRVPPGCEASTMHRMGNLAVRKAFPNLKDPDKWLVQSLIAQVMEGDVRQLRKDKPTVLQSVEKLVGFCKMNLSDSDPKSLEGLAEHYQVDLDGKEAEVFPLVPLVLDRCLDVARNGAINFDDMVYLPTVLNLPVTKYDLLLADECLPGFTPIMLADGTSRTIKEIVEGVGQYQVRSYDTATGEGKNCWVVGKHKIPNKKPSMKINVRAQGAGGKRGLLICTTDHKVWTVERGWVEAGNLTTADHVIIETAATTSKVGTISLTGRNVLSEQQSGGKSNLVGNEGGNGRGLTVAEKMLLGALNLKSSGWVTGFTVSTGQRSKGGMPSHYKLDISNPKEMIDVEVDGSSHLGYKRRDQDFRRDAFLKQTGWTVVRVSNDDATENAEEMADKIIGAICVGDNCPMQAKIISVQPFDVAGEYVYDITVEDCHNFYANGILVHNCQDLNKCQQALAKRCGRRLILVGDTRQAIYGFAGADSESVTTMLKELMVTPQGCVTLPLLETRRCGKAIVREANKIEPDLRAHETNPPGKVAFAKYPTQWRKTEWGNERYELPYEQTYLPLVQDGDMILCRCNAPLVNQCLRFLKRGRRATIQGRDIGSGLITAVKKVEAGSVPDLVAKLETQYHKDRDVEQAKQNPSDTKLMNLQDRYECLLCFTEDANSVEEVVAKITSLFSDDKGPGIKLSSVHRAKGLEASRVFILIPRGAEMPHPKATGWQLEQEMNIKYVAITRAINELIWVGSIGGYQPEQNGQAIPQQQPVANGKPAPTEFTWTKFKERWLVRGPRGQAGSVKVSRKNGSSSHEMLGAAVWQDGEAAIYEVKS